MENSGTHIQYHAVKHFTQSLKMNHYHLEREAGLSEFQVPYVKKKIWISLTVYPKFYKFL